jgi:hypothetical protein
MRRCWQSSRTASTERRLLCPERAGSVGDSELMRENVEALVGGPELNFFGQGRRQQVNVNPARTAPVQSAGANELHNLCMRNSDRRNAFCIERQEFPSAASVSHEEFTEDKIVAHHLVGTHQPVQA